MKTFIRALSYGSFRQGLLFFAAGLLLLIFSAASYLGGSAELWQSPYLTPTAAALLLICPSAALMSGGLAEARAAGKAAVPGEKKTRGAPAAAPAAAALLTVVYCLLLPSVTFIPATFLYLAAAMLLLGERVWPALALSTALSLGLYALFGMALGVMLP